jgi:hypothetical protein
MSDPKRFDPKPCMLQETKGSYVLFDDYASLRQARLRLGREPVGVGGRLRAGTGMTYMVVVRGRDGDPRWITESLLDGLVPTNVIESTLDQRVHDAGICDACDVQGQRCHVLRRVSKHTYSKHCPVLWWDLFKTRNWRVKDLI